MREPVCRSRLWGAAKPNEKSLRWLGLWLAGIAFLLAFGLFFIAPIFWNPEQGMWFPHYVPTIDPIGDDLRLTVGVAREWWSGADRDTGCIYPPILHLLFTPLVHMSFTAAFRLTTLTACLAHITSSILLPLAVVRRGRRERNGLAVLLVGVPSLFSYGFQFELERGQWNVIAIGLVSISVYLFHRFARLRPLSYLLMLIAIHLKVYPAVFTCLLLDPGKANLKRNIRRWLGLAVGCGLMLFACGPQAAAAFLGNIHEQMVQPSSWITNASITAFVERLNLTWLAPAASRIGTLMVGWVLVALSASLLSVTLCSGRMRYRYMRYLILIAAAAAMLLPQVSHDYKLPLMTTAVAFYVALSPPVRTWTFLTSVRCGAEFILLLLSYSLLFSYVQKPAIWWLRCNTLALTGIMSVAVGLLALHAWQHREQHSAGQSADSHENTIR